MIFRRLLATCLTIAAAGASAGAGASSRNGADEALLRAHDAYRAGDALRLQRHAAGAAGHLLAPYLEYWRLKLLIEQTEAAPVEAFLARESGSYLAERLRADWLKELGRRAEWQAFERALPRLAQDDLEIRCYAWLARLARGDESAFDEARAVWLEPRELTEGCGTLAERLIEARRVGVDELWQRVRTLVENGQVTAARRVLGHLPAAERHDEALFNQAMTAPQRLLASPPRNLERRAVRETVLAAAVRLARREPEAVAEVLAGKLGARLPAADAAYAWGRVALEGARRLMPESLEWYRRAAEAPLDDEQLAWQVRIALRAGDWPGVRDAVDRMSSPARHEPAWTYWYARALGALGRPDGARAYFLRISGQPHFYGLLAAEELGYIPAVPEPFHEPTEAEVAAAAAVPGLARALELYRLELRTEATREWLFTVRPMDDGQLLAAAELARRAGVYDRAINTADRTQHRHNYKVRYLAPFREVFSQQARAYGLEEAWVLGLVRQESRFIVNAKSSAGARGLMQLMPATARWMARKIGLRDYSLERVSDVPVNVTLGAGYLKVVLEDLRHEVLASAAYNAGPGRARRWRDAKPLEGAIYAESIPFSETRDYVKKVMANTMYYAQLLGGPVVPLKDRLGMVPAKPTGERNSDEQ